MIGGDQLAPGADAAGRSGPGSQGPLSRWTVRLALICYLAIGFFPYLVSGLLVPPLAVLVLMAVWTAGLVATVRWSRHRPIVAPVSVVAAIAFWFAFVTLGSALFGWTA